MTKPLPGRLSKDHEAILRKHFEKLDGYGFMHLRVEDLGVLLGEINALRQELAEAQAELERWGSDEWMDAFDDLPPLPSKQTATVTLHLVSEGRGLPLPISDEFDGAPVPMAQPPLQWSSEPPTTEGLYWWRRDGEARVVEVSHPPHGLVAQFIGEAWEYVHNMDGEWWPEPLVPPGGEG
jgi:hypothetical protein